MLRVHLEPLWKSGWVWSSSGLLDFWVEGCELKQDYEGNVFTEEVEFKLGSKGWTGFEEQVKRETQGKDGSGGIENRTNYGPG